MAKRGRPRKTRVTKKQIKKIKDEKQLSCYASKKRVIPGRWTNIEPKIKINAKLRLSSGGVMAEIIGPAYGSYLRDDYGIEKGWYPIVCNVTSKNIRAVIKKHGLDQFLAASERSLTNTLDEKGKPKYGTIVILEAGVNNCEKEDPNDRFVSIRAKTNKKSIKQFRAFRKGLLVTL